MTCKELNLWLLAADLQAAPPREVRSHLEVCPRCQRYQQRLQQLNDTARDLPAPPARSGARVRLLRSLEHAPGPRPAFWVRFRWQAGAVAAVLLLAVGGFALLRNLEPTPEEQAEVKTPVRDEAAEAAVVGSILDRQLKLATGLKPAERFQVLMGLADDLRGESLRLAQAPASAELAAVTKLYQRVVREGRLVDRAAKLPLADQKRLIVPRLRQLRQGEVAAEQLVATAPADVAASLRTLAATTRDLRARLSALVAEEAL